MKNAHFIDFDIIFKSDAKPWIVSKKNPSFPIMKINTHDFNNFKSGVYKSMNNKIEFNGSVFYLDNKTMNSIKLAAKKYKLDISNLAISMQEFLNKDIIDSIVSRIDMNLFKSIINTNDDIYIICSRNKKSNYDKYIKKFEEELKSLGLGVKDYYYISETFYNRYDDDISYKKAKLILQHLIGLKTDGDVVTDVKISNYDKIYYYDDNKKSIGLLKKINTILQKLLLKTEDSTKLIIKDILKNEENILVIKEYTHNKMKRFSDTIISLEFSNLIKKFDLYN